MTERLSGIGRASSDATAQAARSILERRLSDVLGGLDLRGIGCAVSDTAGSAAVRHIGHARSNRRAVCYGTVTDDRNAGSAPRSSGLGSRDIGRRDLQPYGSKNAGQLRLAPAFATRPAVLRLARLADAGLGCTERCFLDGVLVSELGGELVDQPLTGEA